MNTQNPPVLFVHGMFVTQHCWDDWVTFFSDRGYSCSVPAWPLKEERPDVLRRKHPDIKGEGHVTLARVIAHYEQILKAMPQPPILIGHSMGGLIVQILLNKGYGCSGVAIDSAPPLGVMPLQLSFFRANWPIFNPFSSPFKPVLLTRSQFQYAFATTLDGEDLDRAYESCVPQSRLVGLGALTLLAKIDFKRKTKPLLIIAGGKDQIIPARLNAANAKKYASAPSRTDFKLFPEKTHYLIEDKGWEEIAEYVLDWLK